MTDKGERLMRKGFNLIVLASVLGSMLGLAACARHSGVVIDPVGVDMAQYHRDLTECEQIAGQVQQKAGAGALGGAIVGGLVGAAVGNSRTAEKAAGAGAVVGGAKGIGATERERLLVIKNCLRRRGYSVLN